MRIHDGKGLEGKTVDDLIRSGDERVELIDGEVVYRHKARSEHALIQSGISDEISPFERKEGPDGWWIMTEISVCYDEHQCPRHDLAGWRKSRVPKRPTGLMRIQPDRVCEIISPGYERIDLRGFQDFGNLGGLKDVFHHFIMLQHNEVPYYWIISPEDKPLIAYALSGGSYHLVFSVAYGSPADLGKVRIPPFEALDIDLRYVFGDEG